MDLRIESEYIMCQKKDFDEMSILPLDSTKTVIVSSIKIGEELSDSM